MKKTSFGLVLFLLAAIPAPAHAVELLKCRLYSYYLGIDKEVTVDLTTPEETLGSWQDGDRWRIAWSVTECEDNTDMDFDADEFKELRAGKLESIIGNFHHAEPDIQIDAQVICSISKE